MSISPLSALSTSTSGFSASVAVAVVSPPAAVVAAGDKVIWIRKTFS
jgi:hypothetical protein